MSNTRSEGRPLFKAALAVIVLATILPTLTQNLALGQEEPAAADEDLRHGHEGFPDAVRSLSGHDVGLTPLLLEAAAEKIATEDPGLASRLREAAEAYADGDYEPLMKLKDEIVSGETSIPHDAVDEMASALSLGVGGEGLAVPLLEDLAKRSISESPELSQRLSEAAKALRSGDKKPLMDLNEDLAAGELTISAELMRELASIIELGLGDRDASYEYFSEIMDAYRSSTGLDDLLKEMVQEHNRLVLTGDLEGAEDLLEDFILPSLKEALERGDLEMAAKILDSLFGMEFMLDKFPDLPRVEPELRRGLKDVEVPFELGLLRSNAPTTGALEPGLPLSPPLLSFGGVTPYVLLGVLAAILMLVILAGRFAGVGSRVRATVASALAGLGDDPEAKNARERILVLYRRALRSLARVGEGRFLHETHREHADRVPSIHRLSALFEKARFSTEDVKGDLKDAEDACKKVLKRA